MRNPMREQCAQVIETPVGLTELTPEEMTKIVGGFPGYGMAGSGGQCAYMQRMRSFVTVGLRSLGSLVNFG